MGRVLLSEELNFPEIGPAIAASTVSPHGLVGN